MKAAGGVTDDAPAGGAAYDEPTDAARLRELLVQAGLSQRGGAKELEISERMMRYYCAGEQDVPKVVVMALEYLVLRSRQVTGRKRA